MVKYLIFALEQIKEILSKKKHIVFHMSVFIRVVQTNFIFAIRQCLNPTTFHFYTRTPIPTPTPKILNRSSIENSRST